jgi:(p)ppGpp synthase/HD superfamily hydrolase
MSTLERAIEIAAQAHAGQKDKVGQPYILHCMRVMMKLAKPNDRMAAALHDVVEDTPWTLAKLRQEGFPAQVVNAVDALTHREGEKYDTYIKRLGTNAIARRVKLSDLSDNMSHTRQIQQSDRTAEILKRYDKAVKYLRKLQKE